MSEKSVQVNIRASAETADGLRSEARERRLPLGDLLAELLKLSRTERDPGLWISLPDEVQGALKSVAAARSETPEDVLAGLVRGTLRHELLQLAASLEGGGDALEAKIAVPRPVAAPAPVLPGSEGAPDAAAGGLALHSRRQASGDSGTGSASRSAPVPSSARDAAAPVDDEDLESVGIITVFD